MLHLAIGERVTRESKLDVREIRYGWQTGLRCGY